MSFRYQTFDEHDPVSIHGLMFSRSKTFLLLFKGPGSFKQKFNRRKCRRIKGLSIDTTHTPLPPWSFYSTFKGQHFVDTKINCKERKLHISFTDLPVKVLLWTFWHPFPTALKVLSHEIDFDNVDENWQMLALIRAAAGFWIFWRHLWFLVEIKHLLSGKC